MAMWNNGGGFPSEATPCSTNQIAMNGGDGGAPFGESQPAAYHHHHRQPSNLEPNPPVAATQPSARRFFGMPVRVSIPTSQPQVPAQTDGLDALSPNYVFSSSSSPSTFQPMNSMSPVPCPGGGGGGSAAESPATFSVASNDDGKPRRTPSSGKRTGRPPIWSAQKTRQLIRNYLWSPSKLPRTLQFFHADDHPDKPPLSDDRAKSQQNGAQKKLNQTIARDPRSLKGNEKDLAVFDWRVNIPDRSARHVGRAAAAQIDMSPPERQHTMMSIKMGAVSRSFSGFSITSRKAFSLLKNLTLKSEPDSIISRQGTSFDPVQHHEAHDDESYHPLPGDLLTLDSQSINLAYTMRPDHDESHVSYDMVWAELRDEPNIWVTPNGLSQKAKDVLLRLANTPTSVDLSQTDCFGNTVLHLLAARKDLHNRLLFVFDKASGVTLNLLRAKNTACQTFLHILARDWFTLTERNMAPIFALLGKIESIDSVNQVFRQLASLRDVYGQTIFHRVKRCLTEPEASDMIQAIGTRMQCDPDIEYLRDAFGSLVVEPLTAPPPSFLAGKVIKPVDGRTPPYRPYSEYVPLNNGEDMLDSYIIRKALGDKHLEDGSGNGALHCLAVQSGRAQPLRKRKASEPLDHGCRSRDTTPGDNLNSGNANASHSNNNNTNTMSPITDDPLREISHQVKNLLAAGCSPSHYNAHGQTALMAFITSLPADSLKLPLLKTLVEAARQEDLLEARSRSGETALLLAARLGKIAAVRELAGAGARQHVRVGRRGHVRGVLEMLQHEQKKHKHDPAVDSPWGRLEASLKVLVVPDRDTYAPPEIRLVRFPDVVDEWGV